MGLKRSLHCGRFFEVLKKSLNTPSRRNGIDASATTPVSAGDEAVAIRVVLVCGADLLHSFTVPGVWIPHQVPSLPTSVV